MRDVLEAWVNDADALQYIDKFGLEATPGQLAYLRGREDDYYISLVGELFARLREPYDDSVDWVATRKRAHPDGARAARHHG